jgi:hypothetical protein
LAAWLVFWCVLVGILSVTLLVQARERRAEAAEGQEADSSQAMGWVVQQWEPFFRQEGLASWYGPGFHGRRAASGRRFNMEELTAAHRWLPFGTLVRVSLPGQDTAIVVQVTDRGPFVRRRIIDLSRAAARRLEVGARRVQIEAFLPPRDSLRLLGFTAGWRAWLVERAAFVLLDTLTDWTAAVRQWERYRMQGDSLWLLVTWSPEAEAAEGHPLGCLWFHLGVPRAGVRELAIRQALPE